MMKEANIVCGDLLVFAMQEIKKTTYHDTFKQFLDPKQKLHDDFQNLIT